MIFWNISVYDRTADAPFPLKSKSYRFNYDRATQAEIKDVLLLVAGHPKAPPPTALDSERGIWKPTFELSGGEADARLQLVRYRHLFDYVPDDQPICSEEDAHAGIRAFSLTAESYLEDESGQRTTFTQAFDHDIQRRHGEKAFASVPGHPESVLRCEPPEPIRAELWDADSASLIAQLLNVYRQLRESRWLQSRCVVSPSATGRCEAILPLHEECRAVLLPFRQLYSKDGIDDLFTRCCKIHNRHCHKTHPAFRWVELYRKRFNTFLSEIPGFPPVQCSVTAQRYLDAFYYGTPVIHASSKKNDHKADLEELFQHNSPGLVVMGFHYILRILLDDVSMTLPIIHKNVNYWTDVLGWTPPGPTPAEKLFG